MEERVAGVCFPPIAKRSAEGTMLGEEVVREVLARLERGERIKGVAREHGVSTAGKSDARMPGIILNTLKIAQICVLGALPFSARKGVVPDRDRLVKTNHKRFWGNTRAIAGSRSDGRTLFSVSSR